MKTPNLDNEIDRLEVYKSNDILSEQGEDLLKEFKEIKEQLSLNSVVKSFYCPQESFKSKDICVSQCDTCKYINQVQ
jgi:hypothetical protein